MCEGGIYEPIGGKRAFRCSYVSRGSNLAVFVTYRLPTNHIVR